MDPSTQQQKDPTRQPATKTPVVTGSSLPSPPPEHPTPPTPSPVRSPLLDSAAEYPTHHHERDNSASFRSLLHVADDSSAPTPPEVWSPPRSPPLTSIIRTAEHRTAPPPAHERDRSLSSASSFKSSKSHADSPPNGGAMGLTMASILKSPIGTAETVVGANKAVAKEAEAEVVKRGKVGGRGGRVVRRPKELARVVGWLRVSAVVLSMVSFSVMAADKTYGWDGDSFDRYREFRYCLTVNVLVFAYSIFQVYVHIHHMCMKQRVMSRHVSYIFDFSMDQILAYLLMSASSAAASRNDDWVLSFGSDEFTKKINGSIAMSFLTFFVLALSSLISVYKLFTS